MKRILVFCMTFAVASAVEGFEPSLRVKFGMGSDPDAGESYLYKVPRTLANATAMGWECTRRPRGPLSQLIMYCPRDRVVCCLYDNTGYVAGVQVAVSKSEVSENVFDWEKRGFTSWDTTVSGKCKSFWTNQMYFVDDEYLARSKENRVASRDNSRTLQAGAVWVTGTNKELLKISNQEKDIVRERVFLKQACISEMGQHYYYNMSKTTKCTYDQMYPWFTLFHHGELSAIAFLTFSRIEVPSYGRDWFEHPTLDIVKAFITNGPPCVYELGANPGVTTMHIFFVDKSWTITCPA